MIYGIKDKRKIEIDQTVEHIIKKYSLRKYPTPKLLNKMLNDSFIVLDRFEYVYLKELLYQRFRKEIIVNHEQLRLF